MKFATWTLVTAWIAFLCVTSTTSQTTDGCTGAYTAYFVVDGSESINNDSFREVRNALISFVNGSIRSNSNTRVGVVVYSDDVSAVINASSDINLLTNQIRVVGHPSSGTFTHLGIRRAKALLDADTSGNPHIMIVMTDGLSNYPEDTKAAAAETKNSGIRVFAVGVNPLLNFPSSPYKRRYEQELVDIASDNSTAIQIENFSNLLNAVQGIVQSLCRDIVSVVSRPVSITRLVNSPASFTVGFNRQPTGGSWIKLTPSRIDLTTDNRFQKTANGLDRSLALGSVVLSDGGTYTYSVGSLSPQAMLTVFTPLSNITSSIGQNAIFETQVTPTEAADGFWLKDGVRVDTFNSKYTITKTATGRRLVVNNVQSSDQGEYTFNLNGVTTRGFLSVRAAITNDMRDVTFLSGTSAQLATFVDPAGVTNGVWRREGVDLTGDNRYTKNTIGALQSLTIPNVQTSQAGQYSYSVDGATTQATLTVLGRMDNFTRNVGESQSFLVNVSPGATAGAWFRNGVPLTSGAKYSITQNTGTLRRMTVQNIQTSDSGEYVYVVNGVESKGYLTVTQTAVNGGFSEWGQWTGPCPVTCGSSAEKTQTRNRRCDNPPPSGGGANCAGPLSETVRVNCGLSDCAIDGSWQQWQGWTETCLATCGVGVRGIQQRERGCNEPSLGGRQCFGESLQTRFSICNVPSCAVDGGFTEWTAWSNPPCGVTCNQLATKSISRSRTCTNPAPSNGGRNCTGPYDEFLNVNCRLPACPINGGVTDWGDWSPPTCSLTCGVGVTGFSIRLRQCTNPPPTNGGADCTEPLQETSNRPCSIPVCPTDGGFTAWSGWTPIVCSATCGTGQTATVTRRRTCTNPPPQNGGRNCQGSFDESLVVSCGLAPCPVDGGFSQWTSWENATACSPTCGTVATRQMTRRRFCNNPAPSNGGRNCTGAYDDVIVVNCVINPCPRDGGLTPWTEWSGPACLQTCGLTFSRTVTRIKTCTNPTPLNGGRDCSLLGSTFQAETRSCNLPNCPIDGGLTLWTQWSNPPCPLTCGSFATKAVDRRRTCTNPTPAFGGADCPEQNRFESRTTSCLLPDCGVDGGYTQWTLWSNPQCTQTCGPTLTGQVSRFRTCTNPTPRNNGRNCSLLGEPSQVSNRNCGLPSCPIDGGLTLWTEWSGPLCQVTCGSSTRRLTRTRSCTNPSPAFGGRDCTLLGTTFDTRTISCNLPNCPINGTFTQWGPWDNPACGATCGQTATKTVRRTRICLPPQFGGFNCLGPLSETQEVSCGLGACPLDGGYSLWTEWSGVACTGTCGTSYTRTVTRVRTCNNPVPANNGRDCSQLGPSSESVGRLCPLTPCPIDGGFTPWAQWNIPSCGRTCGTFVTRTVTRNRTCTNPTPQFGGASCTGEVSQSEVRNCGLPSCPIDGGYSAWSPWNNPVCNVTCGQLATKQISRSRSCNNPVPSAGGAPCSGPAIEFNIVNCNLSPCPIDGGITQWTQWVVQPCSVTCGQGVTTSASRTRQCTNPTPAFGGADCRETRVATERRSCSIPRCPIDGGFNQWSPWDNPACSATCGSSITRTLTRRRQCINPLPQFNGRNCTGSYVEQEIRSCNFNACPIDGGYTPWGEWAIPACPATCGISVNRTVTRRRFCTAPPPQFNGAPCVGNSIQTETRSCNLQNCPGDGFYTQWNSWEIPSCSVTCGFTLTRTVTRRRTCIPPTNGGRQCEGPAFQTLLRSCDLPNCPINGGLSQWSQWSQPNCPDRCGTSTAVTLTRTRQCNNPVPQFNGLNCIGSTFQTQQYTCVLPGCPVNGAYTPWSQWVGTSCDRTCGLDVFRELSRYRNCTSPPPSNGGLDCVGSPAEYTRTACNVPRCPINGGISPWSQWIDSACPVTCGTGLRTVNRYRTCTQPSPRYGGANCTDSRQETINRPCTGPICPVDGFFTQWTQWAGSCTETCGPASLTRVETRTRTCTEPTNGGLACSGSRLESRTQACNLPRCSVNGQPGPWTEWTLQSCSVSCGIDATRTQSRTRQCNNPSPAFGGSPCTESLFDSRITNCGLQPCPINGGFTQWTEWSNPPCPGTCGTAFKTVSRRRSCTNPPPQFNGATCNGLSTETTTLPCNNTNCPVDGRISPWTQWTNVPCPASCGEVSKIDIRTRTCTNPSPQFGGRECPETRFETRSTVCLNSLCPIDGGLSNWAPWSQPACPVTCGTSSLSRSRERFCNNPTPAGGGRACSQPLRETGTLICGTDACPIDGNVTPWGSWSTPNCVGTCGLNTTASVQRTRTCTNPAPSQGGRFCTQPLFEITDFNCVVPSCPIDGGVSPWTEWAGPACVCSGVNTRTLSRTRSCTNPVPSNGGRQCNDSLFDSVTRTCDVSNCPVDGNVSAWSEWVDQACTQTCGTSATRSRLRTRTCTNPPPINGGTGCSDPLTETISNSCNLGPCPIDGGVTQWTQWTTPACSRTCGPGLRSRTRSRTCTNPSPAFNGKICTELLEDNDVVNCTDRNCPVDGGYTPWTDWTNPACSRTCGNATRLINRFRSCSNPTPAFGGAACTGLSVQTSTVNCNNPACIVNGAFTEWSSWVITACPLTCGNVNQRQYRFRSCNNPPASFGGLDCVGNSFDTNLVRCSVPSCPVDGGLTQWSVWSNPACGRTCGRTATKTVSRSRTCTNPAPSAGGRPCTEPTTETDQRNCNLPDCAINGGISQWNQWVDVPCPATCGPSLTKTVFRFRTCSAPYPQNNGLDCSQSRNETQVRSCGLPACPINGGYTPWTTWLQPNCVRTCGRNETTVATRSRACTNPRPTAGGEPCSGSTFEQDTRECNLPECPINGGISQWSQFDNPECPLTCGASAVKFVSRRRTCTNPTPRFGGANCTETRIETTPRNCLLQGCPVNGGFTLWSLWDEPACQVTCGVAFRTGTRRRNCTNPTPSFGGLSCVGSDFETRRQSCFLPVCSVDGGISVWGPWEDPPCSVTCGVGNRIRIRYRFCNNPTPQNGGRNCTETRTQTLFQTCSGSNCPVDGGFTQWTSWTQPACPITCGREATKIVTRTRTCTLPSPSNNGRDCVGERLQYNTTNCNNDPCPIHGGYSPWTPWSNPACSRTCGTGVTRTLLRTRLCNNPVPAFGGLNCVGASLETDARVCTLPLCPINGGISVWTQWTNPGCTVTCGTGATRTVTRERTCTNPVPRYNGLQCTETVRFQSIQRSCGLPPCPLDGGFSPWSSWDNPPCGATCGPRAIRTLARVRTCTNPAPQVGGANCTGLYRDTEVRACGLPVCPINGGLTLWSQWTEPACSRTCGPGTRTRTRERTCTNPAPRDGGRNCTGNLNEVQSGVPCFLRGCPVNGGVSPWGSWSPPQCTVSCGSTATSPVLRLRNCTSPSPSNGGAFCTEPLQETATQNCGLNPCPIDGSFSNWSPWNNPLCPATCGPGITRTFVRSRVCNNPSPSFGGANCTGPTNEFDTRSCNLPQCPINGGISQWSQWSNVDCPVTCGVLATKIPTRTRTCTNPRPQFGGRECTESTFETKSESCNLGSCPVNGGYNQWTPWSDPPCGVTCGTTATKSVTRSRQCNNPTPAFGGANCVGPSFDSKTTNCRLLNCPINGGYSLWGEWSVGACPRTCGTASRTYTRVRVCNTPSPQFGGRDCSLLGSATSTETRPCTLPLCPIDGGISQWEQWAGPACPETCGPSTRTRTVIRLRTCTSPAPLNGGRECPESRSETQTRSCGFSLCPVNGGLTMWGPWGPPSCTVTCGAGATGLSTRIRSCTNPRPSNGGAFCPETLIATKFASCNLINCPIDGNWTPWTPWLDAGCLRTCGADVTRENYRVRTCSNPSPRNGGRNCTGSGRESFQRNCGLSHCPGEVEGICRDTVNVKGVGYRYHPEDCDKYIMCYYNTTSDVVAVFKSCPFGYYWDQTLLRCDRSWKVKCPLEKCNSDCEPIYDMDGSCRAYWACTNGTSEAQCCSTGYRFMPGRGCMPDPFCTDPCPVPCLDGKESCDKRPVWNTRTSYAIQAGSIGWMNSDCPFGQVYDIAKCQCVSQTPSCPLASAAEFNTANPTGWIIQNAPIRINQYGSFNGNSFVSTNQDLSRGSNSASSIALRFRYRENTPVASRQLLAKSVECADCKNASSLVMYLEPSAVRVEMSTWRGGVVRLLASTSGFPTSEWKTVTLLYEASALTVVIQTTNYEYINRESAPDAILMTCGFSLGGDGSATGGFTGDVDYIRYYRCKPTDFY